MKEIQEIQEMQWKYSEMLSEQFWKVILNL